VPRQHIALGLGITICVLGLATAIVCLKVMVAGYSPTPFGDEWTAIAQLAKSHSFAHWLWEQNNEHRLPLAKLAIYADLRWLGARGILLFTLMFASMVAHLWLWASFLRRVSPTPLTAWLTIVGFFGFCIFNPSQWENLTWAFQFHFVLCFLCASAAFVSLVWLTAKGHPARGALLGCIAAATAEFTMSAGLLVWPLTWACAYALRLRSRLLVSMMVAGVLAIGLYFVSYHRAPGPGSPARNLAHPGLLFRYSVAYLDHCLTNYFVQPAFWFWVFAALMLWSVRELLLGKQYGHTLLALLAAISFVLGTAFITAAGRANLGMQFAGSSRYQVSALLFWACGFAIVAIALSATEPKSLPFLQASTIAVVLLAAGYSKSILDQVRDRASAVSLAGQSIDEDLRDPTVQARLAVDIGEVRVGDVWLRAHGDTIAPPLLDPAFPVSALKSATNVCTGALESLTAVERLSPGPAVFRASGWALNTDTRRPVSEIAIVDERGQALATTSSHLFRGDALAAMPHSRGLPGWSAYVEIPAGAHEVRAVALIGDHGCPIPGTKPVN
jgi:hypothetical protein